MKGGKEEQPLTESHRVLSKLSSIKNEDYVFALIIGIAIGVFYLFVSNSWLMKEEDREALNKIKEYRKYVYKHYNAYDKAVSNYLKKLDKKEKEIKSKYPLLITPVQVAKSKAGLVKKALVYSFPLFVVLAVWFYSRQELKKYESFFYQAPKQEDPIGLPKELKLKLWEDKKEYFNNLEEVLKLFQLVVGKNMPAVDGKVKEKLEKVKDFLHRFYPSLVREDILFRYEFLLYHTAGSLYGNLPTGFLQRRIKDYTLKKMLSIYQLRQLPVLYVEGKFLEKDFLAYVLLEVLYHADESYSVLDFSDIDPLKR